MIATVAAIVGDNVASHLADPVLDELRRDGKSDPTYLALLDAAQTGFPKNPDGLPPALRALWADDGLVMKGHRIVVPAAKLADILAKLHAAHQGTKARARQLVYWPGITSDLTNQHLTCDACQSAVPSLPQEPMMLEPPPSCIFKDVSVAFNGNHYLVYVDRLSGWPTISEFVGRDPTSNDIIGQLILQFSNLGVPSRLRSDGGPQFVSHEFNNFCATMGYPTATPKKR